MRYFRSLMPTLDKIQNEDTLKNIKFCSLHLRTDYDKMTNELNRTDSGRLPKCVLLYRPEGHRLMHGNHSKDD
jgi:hypothetical protein